MVVRLTPTIQNEYDNRGIGDVIPALDGKVISQYMPVTWATAKEMYDDAVFNADPDSMDEMPPGIRRAYASFRDRLKLALHL